MIIITIIIAVASFIAGILVGRKNSQSVDKVVNTANNIVNDVKKG